MERVDEIKFGGYRIYQDDMGFMYGTDAVLLSIFTAKYSKSGKKAIDLGTNTGIVPTIILSKKKDYNFLGVEVQKDSYELALKGAKENSLENNLKFINSDILDLKGKVDFGSFDLVTTNPPYMKRGSRLETENEKKLISRTETTATLEDFIRVASDLLKERGELFMVNRPYRLTDIFQFARKYRLEPKRIQMVSPRRGENPNLVLLSFTKGGGTEITVLPEISIRDGNEFSSDFVESYRDF